MPIARLSKILVNLRAALVFALFVVASLPQLVGAHTQGGDGAQASLALHQVMVAHADLARATSGHCQLGQECSAMAILAIRKDSPPPAPVPNSAHLPLQYQMAGSPVSFDPPPPRMSL